MKTRNPASVQSIERGLTILEELSSEMGGLGVSELAKRTRLPASTVHRLLSVFVKRGYIVRSNTGCSYRLNTKFLELGFLPADLFCGIYSLISRYFADRWVEGTIGEIFVKIASRTLSVRVDRNVDGNGTILVPEIYGASPRACCQGAGNLSADGCPCAVGDPRDMLHMYNTVTNLWCACVPADLEVDATCIDRIGAGGVDRLPAGRIDAVVSDLRDLRNELTVRLSRQKSG